MVRSTTKSLHNEVVAGLSSVHWTFLWYFRYNFAIKPPILHIVIPVDRLKSPLPIDINIIQDTFITMMSFAYLKVIKITLKISKMHKCDSYLLKEGRSFSFGIPIILWYQTYNYWMLSNENINSSVQCPISNI